LGKAPVIKAFRAIIRGPKIGQKIADFDALSLTPTLRTLTLWHTCCLLVSKVLALLNNNTFWDISSNGVKFESKGQYIDNFVKKPAIENI
jgi:hypothetical protein